MSWSVTSGQERPELFPHQGTFIEQFFSDPSKRAHLLHSEPGLGASYAVAHLVQRALLMRPDARILILGPSASQARMQDLLISVGVISDAVDRYRYRELQDSAPQSGVVWRCGIVFILSFDFAKQNDIARSLSAVPWTLMIVREAQLLRGLRGEVVRQVVASSPDLKALFTSATSIADISELGIEQFTTTTWRRSDVANYSGRAVFPRPMTQLELIVFHETTGEQFKRKYIEEIGDKYQAISNSPLLNKSFRRSLASSPAAVEEGMRRARYRLADAISVLAPAEGGDDEGTLMDDRPSLMPKDRVELIALLDKCLAEMDYPTADSKLDAFVRKLTAIRSDSSATVKLATLTEYRATLFYLQAQLEEIGLTTHILHGGMTFDEKSQSIDRFRLEGGILLATIATISEHLDLPQVEELVL
jgi:hypothetical protein